LKASHPALRHSVIPSDNLSGGFDLTKGVRTEPSRDSADQMEEPNREVSVIGSEMGSEAESFVGRVVEQTAENGESPDTPQTPEMVGVSGINELKKDT